MSYGILLLRVVVGLAFVGHGTQKLFGWFGGYGPEGTGGFFASRGFRAGVLMAIAAGLSEAGGGALLALGSRRRLRGRCSRS
jgi:putative oxidoreductase